MFADQGGETGSRKGSDVTASDTEVVVPKAPESVFRRGEPAMGPIGAGHRTFLLAIPSDK